MVSSFFDTIDFLKRGIVLGNDKTALFKLVFTMVLFGTIGIFVRYITLPSSLIALVRGIIGTLYLLVVIVVVKRQKIDARAVKKNLALLIISGVAMGFNWILLFEAYNYTTVATATLCYYLAPIFVIVASPILLKEKLTLKQIICVIVALIGMVFVSGVLEISISITETRGIIFGIGAAVLYASVIMLNKVIKDITAYDKTILQLAAAATVLIPYCAFTIDFTTLQADGMAIAMLLVVGILHTGIAYAMYFGAIKELKTQTAAILSYIDPVVAVLLSAVLLKEGLGITGFVGAVLVLGSTLVSSVSLKKE